jgi:large subunit ribosomal protein L1
MTTKGEKMSKLTKKQKKIAEMMEGFNQPCEKAIDAIQKLQEVAKETCKFNETVECHMSLGIDVKHADQQVRSTTVLPAGLGKTVRVCVIAKGAKATEAKEAGADEAGTEEIIDKIAGGWFEFDTLIATPDCMGMLGKLGRVLGPKGLMPNPKTGTVTLDIAKAVKDAKAGKVEFRADKQGMIHCPIGKIQFSNEDLVKNYGTFVEAILKAKPSAAKGTYVKSIYLTTTMGPSIKIDAKNLQAEIKEIVG